MIPHVAPPVWPEPARPARQGRMAATIVRNAPELLEDAAGQAELAKCRVGLLGLPDDTGVAMNLGRTGARNGPSAFRHALAKYGVATPVHALGQDEGAAYPRVFDAGDVVLGRDLQETHEHVSRAAAALVRAGLFPIGIGGGHDLTFAFVRGVAGEVGRMSGVYLDAHLDVRPEVGSGMPFRALMEGGWASGLRCIGLNPLVNLQEHAAYFASRGGIAQRDASVPAAPAAPAFVSLDLDVFDAAYAPGVSALNPCGLSPREVEPLVREAGRWASVRCFDIMELNPEHDEGGRTARLAAHMFLTFLRGLAERAAGAGGAGALET